MRLILPIGMVLASIATVAAFLLLTDFSAITYWAAQQQRSFQNAMAGSLRAIQAGDSLALLSLCGLTFAYGFVHAVGPGHGKVLLGGASLSSHATMRRMAVLTLISSLAQSMTAIIIVVGGTKLISFSSADAVDFTENWLAPISYGFIALIGVYLSTRAGRQFWRLSRTDQSPSQHHPDGCGCGHHHGPSLQEVDSLRSWREMAALVGSIAIRPCTGALFLLVIAWRFDILSAGILATLTMGLGTATFNLMVSGSGVGLRGVLAKVTLQSHSLRYPPGALQLIGGLLIITLSGGMLLQSF